MADPWFHEGLRFTCTRCGDCCTGSEGFVWLNEEETASLARRVGVSEQAFHETFTRRIDGEISLREKENGDCIFWDSGEGCTVYEDRPRQCRTWPFWRSNIASPRAWRSTVKVCPGSGVGQIHTAEEILARSKVIDL